MKGIIKVGNTRTYATKQYENIKPSIEFEIEFDTKDDTELQKILNYAQLKVETYLDTYAPKPDKPIDDSLPF